MPNNPQRPVIILFDHAERADISHGTQYMVIHGKDGSSHRISEKRQQLWAMFTNAFSGEAFLIIYETYNNVEYVADVRRIADELECRAVQELAAKFADKATMERVRSQAISYSKDMVVAGAVKYDDLFSCADRITEYITGMPNKGVNDD